MVALLITQGTHKQLPESNHSYSAIKDTSSMCSTSAVPRLAQLSSKPVGMAANAMSATARSLVASPPHITHQKESSLVPQIAESYRGSNFK